MGGESERLIRDIFSKAKQWAPAIIFFDEIEALAGQRWGHQQDSGVGRRIVSQLLNEFDGIEKIEGVLVIGATNRKDLMDPALLRPRCFDLHINLPIPEEGVEGLSFKSIPRKNPLLMMWTWKN